MKTPLLRAAFAVHCLIAAAPASVLAASFDCSRAGSTNEKAICGDAELSSLDDRLGKAFRQARQHASDRRAFTVDSDKQWRWREQNCHDRACLLGWYHRRSAELETQAQGSIAAAAALPANGAKTTRAVVSAKTGTVAAIAAPATPAPALAQIIPAMTAAQAAPLRLNLSANQVAGIAPAGAAPWPHYVRVDKDQYFYEDARPGAPAEQVGVRYYGVENGQYIIEANRGNAVLRYTCSADCAYIGELTLPGDIEKDMVIVRNDRNSLPSLIINDAINGLLAQAGTR